MKKKKISAGFHRAAAFPKPIKPIPADLAFFLDAETQLQLLQEQMNATQPIRRSRATRQTATLRQEQIAS